MNNVEIQVETMNLDARDLVYTFYFADGFIFKAPDYAVITANLATGKVVLNSSTGEQFLNLKAKFDASKSCFTQTSLVPDSELLAKKEAAANTIPSEWINIGTEKELNFVFKSSIKIVSDHGDGVYKTKLYLSTINDFTYSPLSAKEIMEQLNELP